MRVGTVNCMSKTRLALPAGVLYNMGPNKAEFEMQW